MALVFRRLFQASQRIGGARDEQPAEQGLNHPTPPSWREPERSVERHTAFVRADRRNLNNFIVRYAERQPDVDGEALRSNGFLHLENYLQSMADASAEHEAIAGTQLAIWSLD
jgi:TQXA domain-containing protein